MAPVTAKQKTGKKTRVLLLSILGAQAFVLMVIGIFFMTAGPQEKEWASHKANGYAKSIAEGERRLLKFAHLGGPSAEDEAALAESVAQWSRHRASPDFRTLKSLKQGDDFTADFTVRPVPDPVDAFDGEDPAEQLQGAGVHTFKGEVIRPLYHYISGAGNQSAKYPFVWLSKSPRIAYFPEFLSESLCDRLIENANKSLVRSAVLPHNKEEKSVQEIRTSSQAWLSIYDGPGKELADQVLEMTGFHSKDAEMLQILQYKIGQKYVAHHDYFDPKVYGKQPTLRAATVFLYLADVEEGGETWFPSADGKPVITGNYGSCKGGLKVRPKKRSAVLFYDLKPTGALDPTSMHGGCPVIRGEKWGGTLWLRSAAVL